jgi:hypothetical protein
MGKYWKVTLPLLLAALVVGIGAARTLLRPMSRDTGAATENVGRGKAVNALPLVGTASCSARGCHGSVEPAADPDRCGQNEYTRWAHDRHADAYRVLFDERARNIVKHLGGVSMAHEDPRCLACHVTPPLASLPQNSAFVQEEKLFGVGCESCHGSATNWLVPHTAPDWRQKKAAYAMPDLADPVLHAKACVGCHIGAAADKDIPLRDVNHDLIAAGHPRLTFEFGSYQANMPAHWRPKKKSEARLWAVGQIVSAEAALALSAQRATNRTSPWPEFAEYDCFACHHGLAEPSWRQTQPRRTRPGTLPWGTWYFALTRDLAGDLPALDAFEKTMQTPSPDRALAVKQAKAALTQLQTVRAPTDLARQRVLDRFQSGVLSIDPSWDGAEQIYLALHALSPSEALNKLAPERAFAPGFDSPVSAPRLGHAAFRPSGFIEKLKGLPK